MQGPKSEEAVVSAKSFVRFSDGRCGRHPQDRSGAPISFVDYESVEDAVRSSHRRLSRSLPWRLVGRCLRRERATPSFARASLSFLRCIIVPQSASDAKLHGVKPSFYYARSSTNTVAPRASAPKRSYEESMSGGQQGVRAPEQRP